MDKQSKKLKTSHPTGGILIFLTMMIHSIRGFHVFSLLTLAWSYSFTTTHRPLARTSINNNKEKIGGGSAWMSFASRQVVVSMKDNSAAYWFTTGDIVKVVDDVVKAGYNLKGRHGKVMTTWEKCSVDPTCCCAEWVDTGMSIRVEFQGTEKTEKGEGSFMHYFAEEELLKVKEETSAKIGVDVPFDGMSC
jgi:hypothetical protein